MAIRMILLAAKLYANEVGVTPAEALEEYYEAIEWRDHMDTRYP